MDKKASWSPPSFATHPDDPAFAGVEVIIKRGPPIVTFEMVEVVTHHPIPETIDSPDVSILPPEEPTVRMKPGAPITTEGPILVERVKCPKCRSEVSKHELSLWWCPDANDIAPRCSGCRTKTNRDPRTPAKEDILRVLGAPEWHQKWTRVMRKIAKHPGNHGGIRAETGVVD